MTGDVGQRLLRHAVDGLVRPGRQPALRRQRARLEADRGASAERERVALLPQRFDQPRILHRRRLQLFEEGLHFRGRLAGGNADVVERRPRARRIVIEPHLHGSRRRLDHEQLLLDRS